MIIWEAKNGRKTTEMSIHDVVKNLKTMVFGKQAFGRFSAKERETLYAAIYRKLLREEDFCVKEKNL